MTNYTKSTGYHTSTLLSIFATLTEQKLIEPERLSSVKILLMKEFLVYGLEKDYNLKNSEIVTLNLTDVKKGSFENRLKHKKK